MPYQNLPRLLRIPSFYPTTAAGTMALGTAVTIGTDLYGQAIVFQAPATDTITKIGFRNGSHTTTGNVRFQVRTVDASFIPTTTLFAAGAEATVSVTTSNSFWEGTLATPCPVTKGDWVAIVVDRPVGSTYSGQFTTSSISLPTTGSPASSARTSTSYAYVTSTPNIWPVFGTAGYSLSPRPTGYFSTSFNLSTSANPDVVGNIIRFPYDVKASGVWGTLDFDGNIDFKLLDSDGSTVLASVSNPANLPNTTGVTTNERYFANDVTLLANTDYRIVADPTTATNSAVVYAQFVDAQQRLSFMGGEFAWGTTAKDPVNAASYTNHTNRIYPIGVILSQIDIPTGGGGGGLAVPVSGGKIR
jgi:hypothetical protein